MNIVEERNKSDLAYWFPKLVTAGVPVPRTQIIELIEDPIRWYAEEERLLGRHKLMDNLEADLDIAIASDFGYPCFLRTGQTSGKHDFENCCLVQDASVLGRRIRNLIEFSCFVDILGLPCTTWAARELLPVTPICVLPKYGKMPLVVEQRCFVSGGRLVCRHPYWPPGAIDEGFRGNAVPAKEAADILRTDFMPHEYEYEFYKTVTTVAAAFEGDGSWSVDMLLTRDGWFVTDMAVAEMSYHWPDCDKKDQLQ